MSRRRRCPRPLWSQRAALCLVALVLTSAGGVAAASLPIDDRVEDHVRRAIEGGLEPVDFHHLVFAFDWRGTLSDFAQARGALDRLTATTPIDPLLRDELRLLRARLAVEQGRPGAARELFRSSGGLVSWWAEGPVGLEELADFDRLAANPPREGWRPTPGTDPLGWVRLAGLGWPAKRQLLWLATTVRSDREQPVALRLGAAQVARAWLNGVRVVTTPEPLVHAEDQANAGGWLRRGANLLVVAVASESEEWWLRARLTAPDGGALRGVVEVATPPQAVESASRPAPEVRSLESELRAAVAADRDQARLAFAAYLVERRPLASTSGAARAACRAARPEAPGEARLLEWIVTSEPGAARGLLEEALRADPQLSWARVALARWLAARGLETSAAELLAAGGDEPAVAAAAADVDAGRWGNLALPELARISRRHRGCVEAAALLARRALGARRWQLYAEAAGRLEALAPGLPALAGLEEQRARACGDGGALTASLSSALAADPNRPDLRIRLARLEVAAGNGGAARRTLVAGLGRCPDNPWLSLELARLEHSLGDDLEAARLAHRVVELRPQNRPARRLLELLGEGAEDGGWRRSVDELWALADEAPTGGPGQAVLEHVEVRFLPGQLTEERVQRAILVTDAGRADVLRKQRIAYVPEGQRLRVLAARVLRRDGSELAARQGDTPRLSDPEVNLYYDTRLRVLAFPELEDGDLLEIAYVLSETAEANETGPYVGGIVRLVDAVPVRLAEVELSGPEDALPVWELAALDAEPERTVDDDQTVHLRWRFADLEPAPVEAPPAPRLLDSPYLAYSNHPDWPGLADWYGRHVAPRIRPSRQVEELARRLTDGVGDRRQRIARLYRFVTDEIRYVGLELGEHRFRPFSADWVLSHRLGDCKDKAALLVSLLGAIDIPARIVLVRTADLGPVATKVALMEEFNHAIAYLPDDDLWLDGTASGHDPFIPPAGDQGAWALVVDGAASRPQTTPVVGAGRSSYRYALRRGEGGSIVVSLSAEATGDAAARRRAAFAGSADTRPVERWLQRQFPGARLIGAATVDMPPGADPALIELEASVDRSALLSSGGIRVFPGGFDLASRLVPSGRRQGPLVVAARPDLEWRLTVDLGRPPADLPRSTELATRFGRLRLEVKGDDHGYEVAGAFHLEPGLVAAEDAPALRELLVAVARELKRPLEVP